MVEGKAGAELRASSPGPATSVDSVAPGPALPPGLLAAPPAARVSAGAVSSWGLQEAETPHPLLAPWGPRCRQEGREDPWGHQTAAPWRAPPHLPPRLTGTLIPHHSREAQPRRPAPNSELGGMPVSTGAGRGGRGRAGQATGLGAGLLSVTTKDERLRRPEMAWRETGWHFGHGPPRFQKGNARQ